MENLLKAISERENAIERERHKMSLCLDEIKINPKTSLSVFFFSMQEKVNRYEKSLIRLKGELSKCVINCR